MPTEITDWIPKALVLLVVCLGVVWIPLSRSRLGLSIYAIGSNNLAAFRSGVAVDRTKIVAYALAGLFAAMGGLVLTDEHRHRRADPRALPSRQRRRGRARRRDARRRHGAASSARSWRCFILRLVRSDLTFLSVDPNVTTIIEGTIMVIVVMLGALRRAAGPLVMSDVTQAAAQPCRSAGASGAS